MGRFVDKQLREMKATCVYDRGEGDDDCKYVCPYNIIIVVVRVTVL